MLRRLGEFAEARDLLRKALASDQQSFPQGHPHIATDQANLARVLHDLGESTEARDLMEKAYTATLASLGPDHRHTKSRLRFLDALSKEP